MRRAAIIAALLVLAPLSQAVAQSALGYSLNVPLDQSRRVPFSGNAASVISGNAELIHAYIVSPTDVRVVGRKLGLTNLVVLDAGGRTLFDRQINVSAGDGSVVTIYRGGAATSYACSPYCTPADTAAMSQQKNTSSLNPAAAVMGALTGAAAPAQP